MKFMVPIERHEKGTWVVECPAIPGYVSQGETKEQALKNIEEVEALFVALGAQIIEGDGSRVRFLLIRIRHKKYNIADSCHCEGVCPKQSLTAEIASSFHSSQ